MSAKHQAKSWAIAVCLGVMIALSAGGAGAATGDRLVLGHSNSANAPTGLRNTGTGIALKLSTSNANTPALAVSNKAKVQNLNADELDGLSSTAFQRVTTRALELNPDPSVAHHPLLAIPGLGTLTTACSITDADLFFVKAGSLAQVDISSERLFDPAGNGTTDTVVTMSTTAVTSTSHVFAPTAGVGSKSHYSMQFSTPGGGGRVYTATVTLTSQDSTIGVGKCLAWAQLD